MELKNVILIVIAILVIVLVGVGLYALDNGHGNDLTNATNATNSTNQTDKNVTNATAVNKTDANKTVGDNSPRNNTTKVNQTYKVYNPQSDSYVTVIGEKYDSDVNRWYTYDTDGVRYYNTRINTN